MEVSKNLNTLQHINWQAWGQVSVQSPSPKSPNPQESIPKSKFQIFWLVPVEFESGFKLFNMPFPLLVFHLSSDVVFPAFREGLRQSRNVTGHFNPNALWWSQDGSQVESCKEQNILDFSDLSNLHLTLQRLWETYELYIYHLTIQHST